MNHILRVYGFHDKEIFYLGSIDEKNVYYIGVDNEEELDAGIKIKTLLIHNTTSDTLEEFTLPYPAEHFYGLLCQGSFYYTRFSNEQALLHIHKEDCHTMKSTSISLLLSDVIGDLPLYRMAITGIDDRYCIISCATSEKFSTTHMVLIDFVEQMHYDVLLNFGLDLVPGIETILPLKSTTSSMKEQIAVITGGFHWKEKYDIWRDEVKLMDSANILLEQVMIFEKEIFYDSLKSKVSLELVNKNVLEKYALHKSIIFYDIVDSEIYCVVVDFAENTTSLIKYDDCLNRQNLLTHTSILQDPKYINGKLYAIEEVVDEKKVLIDLHTNESLLTFNFDEHLLTVEDSFIITYKWISVNQQFLYSYLRNENFMVQNYLGIGRADYVGKQLTMYC